MANVNVCVANPTAANVTSGAFTAVARSVTKLNLDNAVSTPAFAFLAAGCSIGPFTSSMNKRQQSGYMLHMLQSTTL